MSNNGPAVIVLAIIGFIFVGVGWTQVTFGADTAGLAVLGVLAVVCLIIGWLLSLATQKATTNAITKFNQDDAQIDRYRAQTHAQTARGWASQQITDNRMKVIDAQNQNRQRIEDQRQARQQARQISEQERQEIENQWYNETPGNW